MTCSLNDTIGKAMAMFATAGGRVERLICVDEAKRATGVVALSDLFAYFTKDTTLETSTYFRTSHLNLAAQAPP